MSDENRSMDELPNAKFTATRGKILELLGKIVPTGGLKYKNKELLKQLVDYTVMEIGFVWTGATKPRKRKSP